MKLLCVCLENVLSKVYLDFRPLVFTYKSRLDQTQE